MAHTDTTRACLAVCVAGFCSLGTALVRAEAVSLDGDWRFALDPLDLGLELEWNTPPKDWTGDSWVKLGGWDRVTTPHDYLHDARYEWTGAAWYRKSVRIPEADSGVVYRLQFDRVASRCTVWVNGREAGSHNGGYTPFELDVTRSIRPGRYNHIAVRVDNRWRIGDVPGPRVGAAPAAQLYPWRNHGGILASARMEISPVVYVANQKVETEPNFDGGPTRLKVIATLHNAAERAAEVEVSAKISSPSVSDGEAVASAAKRVIVQPGMPTEVSLDTTIPPESVRLWSIDSPRLYTSTVRANRLGVPDAAADQHAAKFGIRSIDIDNGHFLLNGAPIRLAGANRVEGHPDHGAVETPELIERDLGMMKAAHLELSRLQHYPLSQAMLDWADRHGMLVILEAPAWGLNKKDLADRRCRDSFHSQYTEMIRSSWNHPSVIGWSVGNEYQSWTAEGVDWTREFVALAKRLDPTRPTTFAALGYAATSKAPSAERRSMHWVDFVSVNYYMGAKAVGRNLDLIHKRWPSKPILISEYGNRADQAPSKKRVAHFHETLEEVRRRDFVFGLSYWSFNDYRSRYPGTNRNGQRPWGLVDARRTPRPLYDAMRLSLPPAKLEVVDTKPLRVRLTANGDFPRLPLRGYTIKSFGPDDVPISSHPAPNLQPGEDAIVDCGSRDVERIQLTRPTGFVACEIDITPDAGAAP